MRDTNSKTKIIGSIFGLLLILILFVGASWLSTQYEDQLINLVEDSGLYGILMYIFITATAIVLAPVSTLPLIPIAVSMWGWVITGIISTIGWVIGSQVAFYLARRYGRVLIQKFVSLDKLEKIEKHLPTENLFWSIVLLRMTIPVDILSYALGLFSHISGRLYLLATIIGVTPFAFFFAYSGSLSLGFQIITIIEVLIFIVIMYWLRDQYRKH